MRVEITDGVGAPWPMTAQGTHTTEGLLPALSMVITHADKDDSHIGATLLDHSAEGEGITQGKRLLVTIKPDGAISLQTWPNAARDGHIFPLGASHHEGDDILSTRHTYHHPRPSHLSGNGYLWMYSYPVLGD